ncbi:MAG: class B sortase [Clostridia bacterium]|nr:class B sortase [Clostridia bacterium]
MADQNNFYPQQPQYIDPQGNNPFGEPQYTAAPVPPQQPANPAPEPEVIIQEVGFADYGFSEGDSVTTGHDFGNIMDDDNASEPESFETFDAFNSQTPNFDPAAVEAAGRAAVEADKATFTNMTPNFDPSAVEQASHTTTDFDRDVFSNAVAVEDRELTLPEEPTFAAPVNPGDFLASMQSAFASMNGGNLTSAPVAPAPEPVPEPAPAPVPEPAPAPVPEPAPAPEPASEPDLIPETVQPAPADTVTNAPASSTINDISYTVPPEEKGPEYWENINKMLGNFEQKTVSDPKLTEEPEKFVLPTPSFETSEEPEKAEEPEEPVQEAKSGFPFSESAQDDDLTPEALPTTVKATEDEKEDDTEINEEDDEVTDEEIDLAVDEKAAKEAIKAEEKAAKARAKAEKRATDGRTLFQKIFPAKGDATSDKAMKCLAIFAALALVFVIAFGVYSVVNSRISQNKTAKLAATLAAAEKGNVTWNDIYAKYPGLQFPSGTQIKFADLYAANQDIVGWIRIPGLGIDYPVLQTSDDTFYQTHNFYKQSDKDGSVFLSSKNSVKDEPDQNTVVYGHTIKKSGRMFSNLQEYKKAETFKKNPIIEFSTLYGDYKYKVFCVFVTNGAAEQDNGFILDYTFPNLSTTESLAGFIAEINQRRLYSTGVDILPTDKLICLSTASFEFENARLVIVGRMLRAGESEEVDASKVAVNENPRYPQAWYDANKVTNPYDKYSHWKPTN